MSSNAVFSDNAIRMYYRLDHKRIHCFPLCRKHMCKTHNRMFNVSILTLYYAKWDHTAFKLVRISAAANRECRMTPTHFNFY